MTEWLLGFVTSGCSCGTPHASSEYVLAYDDPQAAAQEIVEQIDHDLTERHERVKYPASVSVAMMGSATYTHGGVILLPCGDVAWLLPYCEN